MRSKMSRSRRQYTLEFKAESSQLGERGDRTVRKSPARRRRAPATQDARRRSAKARTVGQSLAIAKAWWANR